MTRGLRWGPSASFTVVVVVYVVLVSGSNLPTPLFPLYQQAFGFPPSTVTLLFCSYVAVLIPALLVAGRLADHIGRRPMLAGALVCAGLSSAAFASASGPPLLFAGEGLYGMAAGLYMSTVAPMLRELHASGTAGGGALATTLGQTGGLALGPLVSGVLSSTMPRPTVTPYLVDIAVVTVLLVSLVGVPETRPAGAVTSPAGRLFCLPPHRGRFLAAAAGVFSSWMVAAWMLALSPAYLAKALSVHSRIVSGALPGAFFLVAGMAQLASGRLRLPWTFGRSLPPLAAGMPLVALGAPLHAIALCFVGAATLGVGFGGTVLVATTSVLADAPAGRRAGVVSSFFAIGYVGFSVPVLVAGMLADHVGVATATTAYAAAAVVATCLVMVGAARLPSHHPDPRPADQLAAMPTIGASRGMPPFDLWKRAFPKANTPPSDAPSQ